MRNRLVITFLTSIALISTAAAAAPITVLNYSTPNGNGTATTGSGFNYWDLAYNGSGSTTTDGAALSGGTGDLTDGVIAPEVWFLTENFAGTGPYVGWAADVTPNPTLTFNFTGIPTIGSINIHLDNSGEGGVFAPSSILINGVNTAFTAPTFGTAGFVNFTGLSLTGNSLTLQFLQSSRWVFVSEVGFDGSVSTAVPEPATWALMIGGFGLVGAASRRRRTAVLG